MENAISAWRAPRGMRLVAIAMGGLMALGVAAASATAQEYPSRPVKVIAPSTPGGGFDLVGRVLAVKLSEQMGQQFVVENRPGSGTLIGTQAAARSAPDGYTLLVGGLSNLALNMGPYKQPGYDALTDLVPVSLVVSHSYIMVGRKDLPFDTLREVIAFAHANPGKLTIATSGPGSGQYVGAAIITPVANVNILGVPYKGAQPAYQDLLARRVDLFYDNTTTAKAYIDTGRVKALGISTRQRSPALASVPTIAETGVLDWEMETWFGLFAPAKTPRAIVERLRAEIDKATQSAEVRAQLEQGSGRSLRLSLAETEALVRSEIAKWTTLIKKAGITPA
jgi:tripartite-type tricarboxylate transporter receptor subunit TctC